MQVANVAPGMFQANSGGLYAGSVLVVGADGTQTPENNYQLDASQNVIPLPVSLGPAANQVFLIMYGTGVRHAARLRRPSEGDGTGGFCRRARSVRRRGSD